MRVQIRVTGTVQGVGFRPFVYRQAQRLGLAGWVRNDPLGVLVEAEGDAAATEQLVRLISEAPPPLARVETVTATHVADRHERAFAIVATTAGDDPELTTIGPDTATCAACLAEVRDPSDRRYRYPFTNCTDCGPRYTIVRSVPYDRATTTMAGFVMCPQCQAEYDDPADRRFHAQPNACPACGPRVRFGAITGDAALVAAGDALRAGAILAVKGIGGFHLAADATNAATVAELRRRKARDEKPFAVMVRDIAAARAVCELAGAALAALVSRARPIVLAPRRGDSRIAEQVAPRVGDLGVLLPYTPLHELLLDAAGGPLVMTSGNSSDEPMAYESADELAPLVDGVLDHDRPIHVRCDDSVVRAFATRVTTLRRGRGLAPVPLSLPVVADASVLAVGGQLKNTVALTNRGNVVASPHIGDLEHLANYRAFTEAVARLCDVVGVRPDVVAYDLHPEYLATKFALDLGLPAIGVQHHHAHAAACLTEHRRRDRVVALALDGLGYGDDATLWGGEVLVADLVTSERVAHLAPITLPGGAAAIREPWRMGVAWAERAGAAHGFADGRAGAVAHLARRGAGPTTTSVGRLFDAVAALLGCAPTVTFEGQAAMELEALAARAHDDAPGIAFGAGLDPAPMIAALCAARDGGVPAPDLAAAFHTAVGTAFATAAIDAAHARGIATVVLTGGVFQNRLLSEIVETALAAADLEVLTHGAVPANDGGLAIGQAAVAAARLAAR